MDRDRLPSGSGGEHDGGRAIDGHLRSGPRRDGRITRALRGTRREARSAGRSCEAVSAGLRPARAGIWRAARRRGHPIVALTQPGHLPSQPTRDHRGQLVGAQAVLRHEAAGCSATASIPTGLSWTPVRDLRNPVFDRRIRTAADRHDHQTQRRTVAPGHCGAGRDAGRGRDRFHQGRRVAGRRPSLPLR